MTWLVLTVVAYFIYAIVFVGDRVLVTKTFKQPIAYAFATAILHGAAILFIPLVLLGRVWLAENSVAALLDQSMVPESLSALLLSFLTGAVFVAAIYFLYRSLFTYDASLAIPLVGSLIPVFSLLFSMMFLATLLNGYEYIAFGLLLLGGTVISLKRTSAASIKLFLSGLTAAFFFGVFYTLTEYLYLSQTFVSAFIWARIGTAIAALALLLIPKIRKMIFTSSSEIKNKWGAGAAVLIIHGFGAFAFIMIHYSISQAPVSLINALQGVQYVFLLILVLILSKTYPQLLNEEVAQKTLVRKVGAIALIGLGLFILAYHPYV